MKEFCMQLPGLCSSQRPGAQKFFSLSAALVAANRLRLILMHWLTNHSFVSHLVDCLSFAVVLVFAVIVRISGRRFIT